MQNIWAKLNFGAVVVLVLVVSGALARGVWGGPLDPPAAPGSTMKTLEQVEPRTPISSLPYTISQSGSYYLTGDLTGVSGQPGISVTASDVTIDLNGFTLIGVPGSTDGISAAAGPNRIAVLNGRVRNWGAHGVNLQHAHDGRYERLQTSDNVWVGIYAGSGSIISESTSHHNGWGIYVTSEASTMDGGIVRNCVVSYNTSDGIVVADGVLVKDNVSKANAFAGIHVVGTRNRIEGNNVTDHYWYDDFWGIYIGTGIKVDGAYNFIANNSAAWNTSKILSPSRPRLSGYTALSSRYPSRR